MSYNVLITAGPTREYIDPIRYISNRSSGKMGLCLTEAFAKKGAEVRLITGPICEKPSSQGGDRPRKAGLSPNVTISKVETAEQMHQAVLKHFAWADIIIMAAAVADYRPVEVSKQKIKKNNQNLELKLEKTPDILAELGKKKREGQILVGFALETENLLENARKKLLEKNLDLIIANDEKSPGADSATFIIVEKDKEELTGRITKENLSQLLVTRLMPKS